MYLVIEGNIGSGKHALCNKLGEGGNMTVLHETYDNPFLPEFYATGGGALRTELWFLLQRKKWLSDADWTASHLLADFHSAKSEVFARVNLSGDEYALFKQCREALDWRPQIPDCTLFLYHPYRELAWNIRTRNRRMERHISVDYLKKIDQSYYHVLREQQGTVIWLDCTGVACLEDVRAFQKLRRLLNSPPRDGQFHELRYTDI